MDLAGGSWIFLLVILAFIVAVAYGYWTIQGSGINQHGWKDRDRAMGTGVGKDPSADIRTWTRGTGGPKRKRRMTPLEQRTAEAIDAAAPDGREPARHARAASTTQLAQLVDEARDHVRGPDTAPVTLVEYGEYECPYCAEAAVVVRKLEERLGDDLRLVFRHFPLRNVHPGAFDAAVAAEAAAEQGRFWELHELLGKSRKDLSATRIRSLAEKAGLDLDRFDADLRDPVLRDRVEAHIDSGLASGVNGTPTFFLNNVRYDDDFDEAELGAAIEAARAAAVTAY
jgi:protein-disulfide isomerase